MRGAVRDEFIINQFRSHIYPKIKIVKLHGELESRVIYVTPEETANFPPVFAKFLREDFFRSRDIIIIGYSVLDQDVKNCIDPGHNSLYYVNPKSSQVSIEKSVKSLLPQFEEFAQLLGQGVSEDERRDARQQFIEEFNSDPDFSEFFDALTRHRIHEIFE